MAAARFPIVAVLVARGLCTDPEYTQGECKTGADCYSKYQEYYQCLDGPLFCSKGSSGSVANEDGFGVIPCNPGTYAEEANMKECLACPDGTYAKGSGRKECDDAGKGSIPTDDRSGRVDCPKGTYQPEERGSTCIPCEPGSYASYDHSSACKAVPLGYTTNEDRSAREACPHGTYQPYEGGKDGCLACADGEFNNRTASVKCSPVPMGYEAAEEKTAIRPCKPGFFQPSEGGKDGCQPCADGSFSKYEAATGCIPVPLGYTTNEEKSMKVECTPGHYQPELGGPRGCLDCPAGKFAKNHAAANCTCAPIGHYALDDGTDRAPCTPGFFAAEACSVKCEPCGHGHYSNISAASECIAVALGYIPNKDRSGRIACRAGTFQPLEGGDECLDCGPGKFSEYEASKGCTCASRGTEPFANRTGTQPCGPGYYSPVRCSEVCRACEPGRKSEATTSSTCMNCAIGYHQNEHGKTACKPCGWNVFSDKEGMSDCKWCGADRFTPDAGPNHVCQECFGSIQKIANRDIWGKQCQIGYTIPATAATVAGITLFRVLRRSAAAVALQGAQQQLLA